MCTMRALAPLLFALAACSTAAPQPIGNDLGTIDLGTDSGSVDAGDLDAWGFCECLVAGPCCDGCYFAPAYRMCDWTPIGGPACTVIASTSQSAYTGRISHCAGTSAACVPDVDTTSYTLDCTDDMCPGVYCSLGCTNTYPDCTGYADGCWASIEMWQFGVCGTGVPRLGN
jgi:hypothetical protein